MFREVQHRCRALAALNMLPTFFGEDAAGVFQQRYHGCLTIVPRLDIRDCLYGALCNPTVDDMQRYINEGRLRTWEALQGIRLLLDVEFALESHRHTAQAQIDARMHDSPRGGASEPSWSCMGLAAMDRSASASSAPEPPPARRPASGSPLVSVPFPNPRLAELAIPISRLPKASSWANGLSEISASAFFGAEMAGPRRAAMPWRERIEEGCDEQQAKTSYRMQKGYSSPPPLPACSLPTASVPALRHVVPALCRALWAPRVAVKAPASIRRYSQYS
jgi:hypothetical protein